MKIHHITSSSYSVDEYEKGRYLLVKILGYYEGEEGEQKAYRDMVDILLNKRTEDEVEKKWRERE